MKKRLTCFLLSVIAYTASAWICLAAVSLCSQCGYENPDDAAACSHCNAVLTPADPAPAKADAPTEPDTAVKKPAFYLPVSTVTAELALASSCMEKDQYGLAAFYLRNARALEQLVDPDAKGTAGMATNMLALIRSCDGKLRQGQVSCPVCDGSGKRQMMSGAMGGATNSGRYTTALPCKHCDGRGKVACVRPTDQLLLAVNKTNVRYRDLQTARDYVSVGNAWLPADILERLELRQKITLKRSTASRCASCVGIGRIACGSCQGTGLETCPANCDQGRVNNESGQLNKASGVCAECGGDGFAECDTCTGIGSLLCKKCNGSGETALCKKCDGQGYTVCRRCQSAGEQDGKPCASCAAQGIVECTSCMGSGRKR